MSAGTKVTIAIVVLFAAVLGIYYGFGGPDGTGRIPAELMPPAEDDPAGEPLLDEATNAAPITQDEAGSDLARSIEQALWARTSTPGPSGDPVAAAGDPGGDGTGGQPDDPWVLRAPPLMPEPETRDVTVDPTATRTVEYVVQPDDSMWTIAARWFGDATRWQEIAQSNPQVDPDRLRVGQRLQLPARGDDGSVGLNRAAAIPPGGTSTRPPSGSGRYYTVRSGDTLSTIAETHYRTERRWRDIYEANRSTIGANPDRLQVGMRLRIP